LSILPKFAPASGWSPFDGDFLKFFIIRMLEEIDENLPLSGISSALMAGEMLRTTPPDLHPASIDSQRVDRNASQPIRATGGPPGFETIPRHRNFARVPFGD
jgi:hypothetical protein